MRERIKGEPDQDAEPCKAKTLKDRVRAWMVKPEVLDAKKHWLENGRVAISGLLWGDARDPEDVPIKQKGKGRASAKKATKRQRTDKAGVGTAVRAKMAELTGGIDPELVFDGL